VGETRARRNPAGHARPQGFGSRAIPHLLTYPRGIAEPRGSTFRAPRSLLWTPADGPHQPIPTAAKRQLVCRSGPLSQSCPRPVEPHSQTRSPMRSRVRGSDHGPGGIGARATIPQCPRAGGHGSPNPSGRAGAFGFPGCVAMPGLAPSVSRRLHAASTPDHPRGQALPRSGDRMRPAGWRP